MKKINLLFLLTIFLLGCAPALEQIQFEIEETNAAKNTETSIPTSTETATATLIPTNTPSLTSTPTQVPTLTSTFTPTPIPVDLYNRLN
jgi:hypothetical protein